MFQKICNIIFRKWGGGGVKGRLELFRKFIRFGAVGLPLGNDGDGSEDGDGGGDGDRDGEGQGDGGRDGETVATGYHLTWDQSRRWLHNFWKHMSAISQAFAMQQNVGCNGQNDLRIQI